MAFTGVETVQVSSLRAAYADTARFTDAQWQRLLVCVKDRLGVEATQEILEETLNSSSHARHWAAALAKPTPDWIATLDRDLQRGRYEKVLWVLQKRPDLKPQLTLNGQPAIPGLIQAWIKLQNELRRPRLVMVMRGPDGREDRSLSWDERNQCLNVGTAFQGVDRKSALSLGAETFPILVGCAYI